MSDTKKTKVYRISVLVIDHDDLGMDEIATVIGTTRYPNRCILPAVLGHETREVEWSDEHPLNQVGTWRTAAKELFDRVPQRGVDFACEECGALKGNSLERGWYRCKACGYPGQ